MKKTFFYPLIAILFIFSSCSKSENPTEIPWTDDGGYVSGSYWPFALNNAWHLVNTENPNQKSDYLIHKTLNYEGQTYFQFKPINIEADVELNDGFREENGLFIALHGAISAMGVNTSAGTMSYINTNLKVGEVWTDELTQTISGSASGSIKHTNVGQILEKAATVTINGKTYKDVLKTELTKTVYNSITGYSFEITYEIWLAKGIGIVYEKNTYNDSDSESYGLISYSIK